MSTPINEPVEISDGPDETSSFSGPKPPDHLQVGEYLSSEAREEFVKAMYLGRGQKTVTILGHPVTIRTLTIDEELELSLLIKKWEDTRGYPRAYKTATVALALVDIDGEPFYESISPSENESHRRWEKTKRDFYPAFIDLVYGEFVVLEQEVGGQLAGLLGKSDG